MRKMIMLAALMLGAAGLSGCSSIPGLSGINSQIADVAGKANADGDALAKFTGDDIQAALDDAKANGDDLAAQCYEALLPVVANIQKAGVVPKGGLTAFQRSRDLVKLLKGDSGTVRKACLGLMADAKGDVLSFGFLPALP